MSIMSITKETDIILYFQIIDEKTEVRTHHCFAGAQRKSVREPSLEL